MELEVKEYEGYSKLLSFSIYIQFDDNQIPDFSQISLAKINEFPNFLDVKKLLKI